MVSRSLTSILLTIIVIISAVFVITFLNEDHKKETITSASPSRPPPNAIPVWKNEDLSLPNRILNYIFPMIVKISSMVKCPPVVNVTPVHDLICMSEARNDIKEMGEKAWKTFLEMGTHTEIVLNATKSKSGSDDNPVVEVVLLTPKNITDRGLSELPLVIYFHGGGNVVGNARDISMVDLVKGLGDYVAWASVEYRLSPEYPFPAALDDGLRALIFLLEEYCLKDGSKLGVGGVHVAGVSAGGLLAAMVTQKALQTGISIDLLYMDSPSFPMLDHPGDSLYRSIYDSPSYRRNWYTEITPIPWVEWSLKAFIGCDWESTRNETDTDSCDIALDIAFEDILSLSTWSAIKKLPQAIIVAAEGDVFHDGGIRFGRIYSKAAGRKMVSIIESESTHCGAFMFDPVAKRNIIDTWGNAILNKHSII